MRQGEMMRKVLITGKNSYIGNRVQQWLLERYPGQFEVEQLDLRDGSWKKGDFSSFDSIFHVAGIAHSDTGKADEETQALYYRVNTDLTVEVAKKAQADGVGQFIFMSSMIVYGESAPIGKKKVITRETEPKPANFYGDSKLQADLKLQTLERPGFSVAIVRPPMIYGKGSKGNYPRLAKLAKISPVFPQVANERSMLHIDNLCEFIRVLLEEGEGGIFFPQNEAHVNTSELVREVGRVHHKKVRLTKLFNVLLYPLSKRIGLINKVFGNLSYDLEMSRYKRDYRIRNFKESVELTEG